MLFLLAIYAVSGAIVLFSALVLVVISIIKGQSNFLVYGFCIGLLYSAVVLIYSTKSGFSVSKPA